MTHLLYRSSATPTVPVATSVKGSELTNAEIDANFKSLSDDIGTRITGSSPTITTPTVTGGTYAAPTLNTPTIKNPTNTEVVLTDGATVNWDMDLGHVAKWTITATGRTFATPTNQKVGGQYVLYLTLNTPSTMTPTWPASILWPYGTPPDLTTSSLTVISLVWSSTLSKFLGSYTPGY